MKLIYDKETDVITIFLRGEVQPGVVFDYNNQGDLIRIEFLYASKQQIDLDSIIVDGVQSQTT